MDNSSVSYDFLSQLAGRFIVFDGPDGSGKSTQFRDFHTLINTHTDLKVCEIREPGGTAIGEQIRDVLLDPGNHATHGMDAMTEMMLFMASRAQVVREKIIPARESGAVVMADRFLSSTLAYQGTAGGISEEEILAVGRVACGSTWPPDLILIFDVDSATAAGRLNPLLDRMEARGAEFHQRVRNGFLRQAKSDPKHYAVVDATQPVEAVRSAVHAAIRERLGI